MAIESQGILIRRQSTTAGSTAQTVAATMAFSAVSTNITRSDVGSFVVDGFSTGMRCETDSTANSTRVFTLASVAATVMSVHEPVIAQSSGISITLTGHTMLPIATITGFKGPSGSASVIDITSLQSTAKEKAIGLRDEGQMTLDIIFDTNATSLHAAIRNDRSSRTKRIFDIVLTDQSTSGQPSAFYFDGYVTNFALQGAVDDVVKASATIEISSAVRAIAKT